MLALLVLGLTDHVCQGQIFTVAPHDLLPEQKVVVDGEAAPQWKGLWNEARKSALQGDFAKAERQYRALLVLKDNLVEARWELARIMMYLKRWQEAGDLLELLIEAEPDSIQYINALGKVMWETTQYERAVDLFRKAYEKNQADRTALAGLVEGLIKLDRGSEALPYLEQLVRQEPTNRAIRRYLAFLLYDTEDYEKARAHLTILARNEDVEFEVLYKTAKTYEYLEMFQQAATYWERVQLREQANIEAHLFLAKHYEKLDQLDRSLSHLQAIVSHSPDDVSSYLRLGEMYETAGEPGKALAYYEKYLARHPEDQEIMQKVVAINSDLGKRQDRTASIYPAGNVDEVAAILRAEIRDLETAGRFQDVIPLYQQLIKILPDDEETLAALANDLIAVGKKDGRLSMVEFLSDIVPDNKSIYRSMAELLRRMEREDELLAVLHKIYELDPGDNFIIQELAIIYLGRGELLLSEKYFNELSGTGCWNGRCLEARASLAEKLNRPARRLHDYEVLLELQPNRYEIRLAAVNLAAQMGLLDKALFHAGYLQIFPPIKDNLELKIFVANAYLESGYLARAVERYRSVLEQTSGENEVFITRLRRIAWLGIARSYEKLGLMYETEQVLRTALAQEEDKIAFLEELFRLYLDTGRIAESEIWLQAFSREIDKLQWDVPAGHPRLDWKKEYLQAQMYAAAGDHELALDLYHEAESLLHKYNDNGTLVQDKNYSAPDDSVQIQMAVSFLGAGRYSEAEKILLGLEDSYDIQPEVLILLEKVYRAWGRDAAAASAAEKATIYGAEDFGRQLNLVRQYRKYSLVPRQAEEAQKAVNLAPDSLSAKLMLVEAYLDVGKDGAASDLLGQLLRNYPENSWFLLQQAELLARLGNFQKALDITGMILAADPQRWDIVLLQARIYWELNLWKDSVLLYESIIEPSVEELLQEKIRQRKLSVDTSPAKTRLWDRLTFSDEKALSLSPLLLSPAHAVDFSANGQAANLAAVDLYALYRWQDQLTKELSVRRSVMRREYYHAANKLENLIEEYGGNDFLLYDLAGLYSKLERLSDEADIYRKLVQENGNFPGLSEAIERNNLKRRPQLFFAYTMQDDDGWDGYKAVRQTMFKGGGKFYQTTNREWGLDVGRIKYESTRDDQHVEGWRTMLTYDARLSQALGISLGGGLTTLESGYDDTPLLYAGVIGKIADEMRAVFSIRQDVVADTIASLKRNIRKQDYKLEVVFDLFPRLLLGGYYDFIDYSDNNWTNNYAFWASYILLPEPTLLKMSYNYDFYDSREGQIPGPPTNDGFGPDDHPYWSPLNYWVTRFSLYFKHQLSKDTLARGVPSYYTIEYSLGYDAEDNDLHELKGSLNIEIARNYILSAAYGYVDLDAYQHKEALLSIMYRF